MGNQKLDPEFKAKWVAALRSGDYKQGVSFLYSRQDDAYCCLGVAATLCGLPKDSMLGYSYIGEGHNDYLPPNDWFPAVLTHNYSLHDTAVDLAMMNDRGRPFSAIADWIEQNL